jgi:hypothetical protein
MAVTDADISSLADSHDIITIGMQADAVRREKHGNRTTFLRVAVVDAAPGAALTWPAAAGEIRIAGIPASRAAAVARAREVASSAKVVPVAFAYPLGTGSADSADSAMQPRFDLLGRATPGIG